VAAEEMTDQEIIQSLRSMLRAAGERESLWLDWAAGRYPDDSPGDVIAAEPDGTITLDDGITTWNPIRAAAFFQSGIARIVDDIHTQELDSLGRVYNALASLAGSSDKPDA